MTSEKSKTAIHIGFTGRGNGQENDLKVKYQYIQGSEDKSVMNFNLNLPLSLSS